MREKIIALFQQSGYHPMDAHRIAEVLGYQSTEDFIAFAKMLATLEAEYVITHNKRGEFDLLENFHMAVGIIDIKDAGYAFVDTVLGRIYVKEAAIKGAITYDKVLIKFFTDQKGRYEGVVDRVIERNTLEIVGPLVHRKGKYTVKSVNSKINLLVFITDKESVKARAGQIVKVKIQKYCDNGTADGKIIQVFQNQDAPGMDITSMVLSSGVVVDFTKEAQQAANAIVQVVDSEQYLDRRNLCNQLIITIDGDDAKDLDDAVSVERLANGNVLLGVYIADVSEYVTESSFLDMDAFDRGTSIYLPDRVIPMLPKQLSNGICSLYEGVVRLAMACEMEINPDGLVVQHDIFEALIKSTHRMTYDQVNQIVEQQNPSIIKDYQDVVPMLETMQMLAGWLNEMRIKRGSFEFETQEPKLILNNQGKVVDITLRERKSAEKMIEEFMLIANETVAQAMTWLDVPFLYRVHEEPKEEKISRFLMMLDAFGYHQKLKNKKALPKFLQTILMSHTEDEDESQIKQGIINTALLRSMSKARYQEQNIGHFGLASTCYTHFTSPIRRYPDLLVHRLIKQFLLGHSQGILENPIAFYQAKVNQAGVTSSKAERLAESLERDTVDMKKAEYMEDYIGETFTGIVSSIANWGIYVTLENTVEGLVRFENMPSDYYEVDEIIGKVYGVRTKTVYMLGDTVQVKVLSANKLRRQVDFRIVRKEAV